MLAAILCTSQSAPHVALRHLYSMGRAKVERVVLNASAKNPPKAFGADARASGGYMMASSSEKPITFPQTPSPYFNSSFTSAKAFTANSKSSRECAADTCVRTRAVPCGTTG